MTSCFTRSRIWLIALGGAAPLLSAACHGDTATAFNAKPQPPLSEIEKHVGYRPGPWWRDAGRLNDLVLAGAQIVLTHRASDTEEVKTRLLRAQPARSREEALRLAFELKSRLRSEPTAFAALVNEHTDDLRTAPSGGFLGSFRASDLPPSVIDAFGNVKIGDVSRIVETNAGFYLVRRLATPPAKQVSARRIVIKHRDSEGWARLGRSVTRTHAEARQLAERVAVEARKNARAFPDLVLRHSDAFDAAARGDFGSWSTHERGDSVSLSVIAGLKPGGVSRPIENWEGIHVFQRTADTERPVFSMSHLVISYDIAAFAEYRPPARRSKNEARALAEAKLHELRIHPNRFHALRQSHCDVPWVCDQPYTGPAGRGIAGIDARVLEIEVGALVDEVIETPVGFHLVRRENPEKSPLPGATLSFEFHRPAPRDLKWVLSNAPANELATATRHLGRDATAALKLEGADAQYFSQILDRFAEQIATVPVSERHALVSATHREIQGLLGADRWRLFEQFQNAWLVRQGI